MCYFSTKQPVLPGKSIHIIVLARRNGKRRNEMKRKLPPNYYESRWRLQP